MGMNSLDAQIVLASADLSVGCFCRDGCSDSRHWGVRDWPAGQVPGAAQPVQGAVSVSTQKVCRKAYGASSALTGFPVVPAPGVLAFDGQLEASLVTPPQLSAVGKACVGFAFQLPGSGFGKSIPVQRHLGTIAAKSNGLQQPSAQCYYRRGTAATFLRRRRFLPVPGSATEIPSPSKYCLMAASPISERFMPNSQEAVCRA